MGTHPIFESDFDCLTENKMSDVNLVEKKKKKRASNKDGVKRKKKPKKSKEQHTTTSELSRGPSPDEVYNPETIRWLNRLSDDELEKERIQVYKKKRRALSKCIIDRFRKLQLYLFL